MKGPLFKNGVKNSILLWIHYNWPRVDQWAIDRVDTYPCEKCLHFDNLDCVGEEGWVGCKFVDVSIDNPKLKKLVDESIEL